MLTYPGKLHAIFRNQQAVYSFICIGIASSLIFWPPLNSVFCGLLLAYWLASPGKTFSFKNISIRKVAVFAALYLPVVVGCLYSNDLGEASFRLQQKSALLLFPLVFGSLPIVSTSFRKRIFWTLVFSTLVGCLICLANGLFIYFTSGKTDHLYGYSLVVLTDMHPSILGLCCLLSLAFLFEEVITNRFDLNSRLKFTYAITGCFLIMFLFLVGNRISLICLNAVIIFYIFRAGKTFLSRATGIAVVLLISVAAICYIPSIHQRWKDLIGTESSFKSDNEQNATALPDGRTARIKIWTSGLEVVKNNWWIGVGTGDSQAALQSSYTKNNYRFAFYNNCNAHNQYLQETIAFGIPGLVIFLLCIAVPFFYLLYSKVNSLYLVFLLLFAFVCLSESVLQLNKGIIWYSFFNSLLAFGIPNEGYKR